MTLTAGGIFRNIPMAAPIFLLTLSEPLESPVKYNPMAWSEIAVRTPIVSLSHPEHAPLIQARIIHNSPNALVVAQATPAAPRFPITRDSAAVEPMRVVKALISRRLLPKLIDGNRFEDVLLVADMEPVKFASEQRSREVHHFARF